MGRRPRSDMAGFHHVVNRGAIFVGRIAVSKVIMAMSRKVAIHDTVLKFWEPNI